MKSAPLRPSRACSDNRSADAQILPILLLFLLLTARAALGASVPGPPYVVAVDPPPGTVSRLTQITFTFNEPVTDVVHNDLRLNDNGALNRPSVNGDRVVFVLPAPPWGPVKIELQGIKDFDSPANTMAATNFFYTLVDDDAPFVTNLFPRPRAVIRNLSQVEVTLSEPVKGVEASDLLVAGTPATNLLIKPGGLCIFQFPPPLPGLVSFQWAANHGITDYAAAPNAFIAPGAWTCQIDPNLNYPDLAIT